MLTQAQSHLLTEGAQQLGIQLSSENIERFALYLEEIARWSKIANLVAQADAETVIRKHMLDSLAIVPLIPPAALRLLDLGSGAGFPGLVIAIMRPSLAITLVEPRRKRVSFLKEVIRKTKLKNVSVYEERAETLAETATLRASFHVVVTRATWSLKEFLPLASPFLLDKGLAVAMKGPRVGEELHHLDESYWRSIHFSLEKRYTYALPFGGENREAVLFEKEKMSRE